MSNLSKIVLGKMVVLSVMGMSSFMWAAQESASLARKTQEEKRSGQESAGEQVTVGGQELFNLDPDQQFWYFMAKSDEDIQPVLAHCRIKGHSLLVVASLRPHDSSAKRLLDLKADPNQQDGIGQTPLCAAASKDHGERVVRLLIAADANVNQPNRGNETPLEWALRGASRGRDNDVLEQLIQAEVDLNAPVSAGMSPLCFAIAEFPDVRLEEVQALVAAGATVGAQELAAAQSVMSKPNGPEVLALLQNAPWRQKSFRLLAKQAMESPNILPVVGAGLCVAVRLAGLAMRSGGAAEGAPCDAMGCGLNIN